MFNDYSGNFDKYCQIFLDEVLPLVKNVIITTHIKPDGDAIGSSVGLWYFFAERGISARIIINDAPADEVRQIDVADCIEIYSAEEHKEAFEQADLLVIADLNTLKRTGDIAQEIASFKGTIVVIDHHQEPDDFAQYYLVDTDECSTCSLVYRLLKMAKATLVPEQATALFSGILTDTGGFRYPRTTADTFRAVADLIDNGVNVVEATDKIISQTKFSKIKLLGEALSQMEIYQGGSVCVMRLTKEQLDKYEIQRNELDGFVPHTLSVKGVLIGVFMYETEGELAISLRSKGSIPVNKIAQDFGGGGHINAAGIKLKNANIEEVLPKILLAVAEFLPHKAETNLQIELG